MELSPHQIRTATFAVSRKGLDPDEVTSFLARAADALEAAQNHSTAMEAKARAAVAKLQERAAETGEPAGSVPPGQADEISRTLLLAQRAADEAVAEARREADRLLETARADAAAAMEASRQLRETMEAEARAEAVAAGADERERTRSEVEALRARREFLAADVDHLEQFLVDQRERLREAAATLVDVAERVPGGLGHLRAPLLSAADESDDLDPSPGADAGDASFDPTPVATPVPVLADESPAESDDRNPHDRNPDDRDRDDRDRDDRNRDDRNRDDRNPWSAGSDDGPDTEAVPLVVPLDVAADDPTPASDPMQLRFRPDVAGRTDTRS